MPKISEAEGVRVELKKACILLNMAEKGMICWNSGHCKNVPRKIKCAACNFQHELSLKKYKHVKDFKDILKCLPS